MKLPPTDYKFIDVIFHYLLICFPRTNNIMNEALKIVQLNIKNFVVSSHAELGIYCSIDVSFVDE